MGNYVFSRTDDMFKFFRRTDLGINPGYWAEKCHGLDRDGITEFSVDKFKECVREHIEEWPDEARREAEATLFDDLSDFRHATSEAYRRLDEFYIDVEGDRQYRFFDVCEFDVEVFTHRFLWCLFAIVWAIQQYDSIKRGSAQ